jgi:hypothetical protein
MNEKNKKPAFLSLAKELSRNEQKKITGGVSCDEPGYICVPSQMNCTISQINVAYCEAVWHTSNVENCTVYTC